MDKELVQQAIDCFNWPGRFEKFGSIYLDMTSSNSGFYYLMFIAFLLVGFILLIIYVASNSKFKKGIKKLSDEELK